MLLNQTLLGPCCPPEVLPCWWIIKVLLQLPLSQQPLVMVSTATFRHRVLFNVYSSTLGVFPILKLEI